MGRGHRPSRARSTRRGANATQAPHVQPPQGLRIVVCLGEHHGPSHRLRKAPAASAGGCALPLLAVGSAGSTFLKGGHGAAPVSLHPVEDPRSGSAAYARGHRNRGPERPEAPRARTGADGRSHSRHRRRPARLEHLVSGRRLGRRVEDHQRRRHLDADLRRPGLLLDRRRRPRPVAARHRVGGDGRERERPPRGLR
jgi:hypothetical protein